MNLSSIRGPSLRGWQGRQKMVTMSSVPSLRSLLLAFVFLRALTCQAVYMAQQQHHIISVESLLSSTMCSWQPGGPDAPTGGGAIGTHTIRRVCQPQNHHMTLSDHSAAILLRDGDRVQSIHRRLSQPSSSPYAETSIVPARQGLAFHTHEYVVTVGIGTPPSNHTVLLDTGGDLTWVQCAPCRRVGQCYGQDEPMFDPRLSSTYAYVSCSAPECRSSDRGSNPDLSCAGNGDACVFHVRDGYVNQFTGYLARDTVALSPLAPLAREALVGCTVVSGEPSPGWSASGRLGLGRGRFSILSQTERTYNGSFSYCLPPHGSSTGYLSFGTGRQQLMEERLQFTSLMPSPDESQPFYLLNLTGISVNNAPLPVPAETLSGGAIIDSGTVFTSIRFEAYYILLEEFKRQMGQEYRQVPYQYPSAARLDYLDQCYNVSGHDIVTVPRVALVFDGGAGIDVHPTGILFVADASVACFAFQPMRSTEDAYPGNVAAVVGTMQQRGYDIVFDVAGRRVGFGAEGCS